MKQRKPDPAFSIYNSPEVVAIYAASTELQSAERLLFERYIRPGAAVLDVGVGAGRTTSFLASRAGKYVGVDYSEPMLEECRRRFPGLTFLKLDAADMTILPASSFDAVVFSYNGIDALPTREARRDCLRECSRLLKSGGALIFSDHHARYVVFVPVVSAVSLPRALWRCAYAMFHTSSNLVFRLPRRAFWRSAGYVQEPFTQHGLRTYMTTPRYVADEVRALGLEVVDKVGAHYPRASWPLMTPWYHYVCLKGPESAAEK